MTSVPKVIDVEVALQEKIPDIYKKIPAVILRLIKKVIRQGDINRMIHESSHLHGIPLVDWALDQFGVDIIVKGKELIPKNGQFIFPANHPIGSLDGLAIISVIATIHRSVKFIVNDLLKVINGFEPVALYIARFGQINKQNAISIKKTLTSDAQLLVQPAGTVSKRNPVKISDLPWNKFLSIKQYSINGMLYRSMCRPETHSCFTILPVSTKYFALNQIWKCFYYLGKCLTKVVKRLPSLLENP